ncbi:hypothetical protein H257_17272 [Aphanomyces astaci]|uniref:Chromo domain-containing protein n=1 Tax=Aphanomyces astaci TaxID=112090 RepID=W4FFK8_APHAT|nr:hypothetical protein H257_17272 [Aphanomyces astaci]ETV66230.1 hypothetical protein H257_17272 [Aphanomyces astaci]|eukprot:XP_009844299.1 hypothetical protein H257_17272 [Aphanomyces astaci]
MPQSCRSINVLSEPPLAAAVAHGFGRSWATKPPHVSSFESLLGPIYEGAWWGNMGLLTGWSGHGGATWSCRRHVQSRLRRSSQDLVAVTTDEMTGPLGQVLRTSRVRVYLVDFVKDVQRNWGGRINHSSICTKLACFENSAGSLRLHVVAAQKLQRIDLCGSSCGQHVVAERLAVPWKAMGWKKTPPPSMDKLCFRTIVKFGAKAYVIKPNEILHWEFLYKDCGYILVAKNDFSQFKWLKESDVANAQIGSLFKNEVIAKLKHVLRAHHYFTTARCPWANGTVESAMKATLKAFRALLSEWLMQPGQWPLIVPVVMLVLKQSPSDTLGGVASITATTDDLLSWRNDDMTAMATALDKIPAQVVKTTSDWIFEIQNLVTGVVREAHSSRLKFYADNTLDVTEDRRPCGRPVPRLPLQRSIGRVEVCVRWRGLQEIEDSWEPAANLLEDIPTEYKRYVCSIKADAQVKAMATALGVMQSLGGIVANWPFAEPLNPSQEGIKAFD